jgi:hypothetical protein
LGKTHLLLLVHSSPPLLGVALQVPTQGIILGLGSTCAPQVGFEIVSLFESLTPCLVITAMPSFEVSKLLRQFVHRYTVVIAVIFQLPMKSLKVLAIRFEFCDALGVPATGQSRKG